MSRGPPPTQLCLLSDLPSKSLRDKVRFLGCVQHYSTATACLTLTHNFPEGAEATALVDVNLLLEKLTAELTRVGEWVNVTGYISETTRPNGDGHVPIQALLLWSAGPLDLQRYERSLVAMKAG
ncbi:CST complex subunit Ten1 [Plectosphaerella cucumerina]|uniref:CST complex subunit Ten1 n=1 Tax=Plectosphaerella cucumerina TaxID=40658 RepID=A0A8K0TAH5_9PEZI|nr:CST complex subunit Ten1 [Plectosphaerella cucumerina]